MQSKLLIRDLDSHEAADSIRQTLENTAGVRRAEVSGDDKTALVEFDSETVPAETLLKKIADLGYEAVETDRPNQPR